jgi:hypothetical protein
MKVIRNHVKFQILNAYIYPTIYNTKADLMRLINDRILTVARKVVEIEVMLTARIVVGNAEILKRKAETWV